MDPLDFVAVGDITTDAFIRIKDAKVNCDINRENCTLCFRFGDKVPYENVTIVRAVGNSPNAAVSASRLGLKTGMVTDVGDDLNGEECIEKLREEGINAHFATVHADAETNYHYVLWYEDERTILIKHEHYTYRFPHDMPGPKWMYVSSIGANSLPYHKEIAEYLKKHPETKLAFQPGTFQLKAGYEALKDFYTHAEVVFCNKEEAQRILGNQERDVKKLLQGLQKLGPKIVIITDSRNGASAIEGNEMWHLPMYPDPKPPFERTGAGDAFSSTVTSALALGKPLSEALLWGPINSMSVVQYVGAQKGLLSKSKLEYYLQNAPKEYKVSRI